MASRRIPGILLLEDGTSFEGWCSADGTEVGKLRVSAGGLGAEELVSDPASIGAILCMTDPVIGACGANAEDLQSRAAFAAGVVVRELVDEPAGYRSLFSLRRLLGCPVLEGVDVDAVASHLASSGPQRAVITTDVREPAALAELLANTPAPSAEALLKTVSTAGYVLPPHKRRRLYRVTAYDLGIKTGVLARLAEAGCEVTVVPWDASATDVLASKPDGVVLPDGPEGCAAMNSLVDTADCLIGHVPLLGIGLGFGLVAAACGAHPKRAALSDFGMLRPVTDLVSRAGGEVLSSQRMLLEAKDLGMPLDGDIVQNARHGRIRITHRDESIGCIAGIHLLDSRALAVGFNPEGRPGPHDFSYVFDAFTRLMDGVEEPAAGLAPARQPALASDRHGSADSDSWIGLSLRVRLDAAARVETDPASAHDPRLVLTDIEYQRLRDAALAATREAGHAAARADFVVNIRDGRAALEQLSCLDDGSG